VLVPTIIAAVLLETVFLSVFGPDSLYAQFGNVAGSVVGPVLLAAVIFGSYILYSRVIDATWPSDLRRAGAGRDLAVGSLLGSGLFTAALAVVWLAGGYSVVGTNSLGIVVPAIAAITFFVGIEEVINRGIILPEIESRLGSWVAIAVSSAIFAAYHIPLTANPTALAVASIFLAGLLMGGAYVYTRQLWLPIAIHAGWNFTQGAVFGVSVSGNEAGSNALLVGETAGPAWLSGGAYGLEGSLVTLAVLALGAAVVLWQAHRRGRTVSRTWRRM
jgi:membrane protease YdiL (CAAX protease family)